MVTGPLLARMLGPDGRGYLAALILWPLVITQLGNLGIPSALTYSIARDPRHRRRSRAWASPSRSPRRCCSSAFQALWLLADPARRPGRGPGGRMADPGARPGDARPAVRPRPAAGPPQAAAVQRAAPAALAPLRGRRRHALRRGRRRDRADRRRAPGRVLDQRHRLPAQRAALLARGGRAPPSTGAFCVSFGLRGLLSSLSAVDVLRPDQVVLALFLSPSALGLYVVGLAFTNLPYFIAKSVGLITFPWVASRQEEARRAPDDVVAALADHRNRGRHRRRALRLGALAGPLLLREPVRRRRHGHLHRAARARSS